MADLISNPDYAGQIAQGAAIQGNITNQYATAALTRENANKVALANKFKALGYPFLQKVFGQLMQEQPPEQQQDTNPDTFGQSFGPQGQPATPPTTPGQVPQPAGAQPTQQGAPVPQQGTVNQEAPTPAQTQSGAAPAGAPMNMAGGGGSTSQQNQPAEIRSTARQMFQPQPTAMNPQQAQQYNMLAQAGNIEDSGIQPGMADAYRTSIEQANLQGNQKRTQQAWQYNRVATDIYKAAQAGRGREAIDRLLPQVAAHLPATTTDAQIADTAKLWAAESYGYSGREWTIEGGVPTDKQTAQPIVGAPRVGISNADLAKQVDWWKEYVDYPNDKGGFDKEQRYKHANAASPEAAAYQSVISAQKLGNMESPDNATGVSGAGAGTTPPVPPKGAVNSSTSATSATTPPAASNDKFTIPSANSPNGKLDFSNAINTAPKGKSGSTFGPEATTAASTVGADDRAKITEAGVQKASAQSKISRDNQILQQLNGATVGPGSETTATIQTVLQEFLKVKGFDPDSVVPSAQNDPAKFQVLKKLLGTLAIADSEDLVQKSGGMRMSALMSDISINKLSANTDQSKDAIRKLVNLDIANNKFVERKYGEDFNRYLGMQSKDGRPLHAADYENNYPVKQQDFVNDVSRRITKNGDIIEPPTDTGKERYRTIHGQEWVLYHDPKSGKNGYINPEDPTQFIAFKK